MGCITAIMRAVAFFPVHTVGQDPPIAYTRHTSVWYWGTPTNDLSPSSVPYKPPGPLFGDFNTKRARGMRFIGVALYGNISFGFKWPVHPTIIFVSVLSIVIFWPDSCWLSLIFSWAALEALDRTGLFEYQKYPDQGDIFEEHLEYFWTSYSFMEAGKFEAPQ